MEIKKTGSLILSITKQRIWMYLLWLTVGLFHLPVAAQGCIASPVVETYLVCTGSMNESLKCEPRSVIKGWNISYCPPSPQSPPPPQATQSPPQAQAPQPVASISASKECLLLEAQIEHNYLQCVTDAKKKYADNSALCPPSTSNSVGGGVNGPISGSASNTISPNGTCVSGHARTQGADMAQCASNRSALNINYVNQCK